MKRFLAVCVFLCIFLSLFCLCVHAEDIEFSTKGCTWSKINDTTYVTDTDGDGIYDITLVQNGNDWVYSFAVPDPEAEYYVWEDNVPDGYEIVNGKGSRSDPIKLNEKAIKYAHSDNVDDAGKKNSEVGGWKDLVEVVSIPGAAQLKIDITYGGYSTSSNPFWTCIWTGSHENYKPSTDFASSFTGKLSPALQTSTTKKSSFTVDGDTVTIGMRTTGYSTGYGYYAVVTGLGGKFDEKPRIVNKKDVPVVETGDLKLTKKVVNDDVVRNFVFDIDLSTTNNSLKKYLSGSQTFGDVTFVDGKSRIYLKNTESIVLSDIPSGVRFDISEVVNDGYDISWNDGSTGNLFSGIIQTNTELNVVCTNTKPEDVPVPLTSLKIVKASDGVVNATDRFDFKVVFWDLVKNTAYDYVENGTQKTFISDSFGMADVTLNLGFSQFSLFSGLPVGASWQVMECANAYVSSYEISGGDSFVSSSKSNGDSNVDLSTSKELFRDGIVPVVTFVNKGADEPDPELLNITVNKVWDDSNNVNKLRPEFITVYLLDDGNVVGSAKLDENNNWQTVFSGLRKFRGDGVTPCEYSVAEVQVPGYVSSVDKKSDAEFVITNTSISVGDLHIFKTLADADSLENDSNLSYGLDFEFEFEVELIKNDIPVSGVFILDDEIGTKSGSIVFDENGKAIIGLKRDESACIKNLPADTKYKITETSYKDFKPVGSSQVDGIIKSRHVSEVKFENQAVKTLSQPLPDTGGSGIFGFIVLGVCFIVLGLFILRKRGMKRA